MKKQNKLFSIATVVFVFSMLLTTSVSGASLSDCVKYCSEDELDSYLIQCRNKESEYSNIPEGFMEAILLSPPSSIYDVGIMHINPEDYASTMLEMKVTDMEKPESNMMLASNKLSELFDKYGDPYLVLVNYFNASEEQDVYISDVYRTYLILRSINRVYSTSN